MGKISISFTNSIVNPGERNYLRTLPKHIRLEFQLNDDPFSLLLVHGSPRRINEYLFEDRDEKSLFRILQEANATICCFGHTHKPYHRVLNHEGKPMHAINIGSVGKPKDGDPRGCYAVLTIEQNKPLGVKFLRFEYEIEKAAKAIEQSVLPDEYAEMLRKGV